MKKIFHSPVTWTILFMCAGAILVAFLYYCGFRITYAPTLENSWAAISACASWFGAIMSACAMLVAIRIPTVIAKQQNKIALFDKRYSAWDAMVFLMAVAKQITDDTAKEMDRKAFLHAIMETYKSVSIVSVISGECKNTENVYVKLVFEAGKMLYLFDLKEADTVCEFLKAIDLYVSSVYQNGIADDTSVRELYAKLVDGALQDKVEEQLMVR